MQNLFNAAALEGGYYNTAALEGGMYNGAALLGGGPVYNNAAIIGGFALAKLATSETEPSPKEMIKFGAEVLKSLPPTVRDTIAKMFNPKTDTEFKRIYGCLALLYLLDSLKAISIAPEMDLTSRNMARQRWVLTQRYLQQLSDDDKHVYNRLLRYIHIPHYGPKACKAMRDRWLNAINNRSRPWGRSKAFHALPHMTPTTRWATTEQLNWDSAYSAPTPYPRAGKKAKAKKRKAKSSKKSTKRARTEVWVDPYYTDVD